MKSLIKACCLAALLAAPARAAFEDVDAGPRAAAMSGAYAAQTDGVSSIFYNPAGVIGTVKYEAALAQQKLFMGLSDGSSLSRSAIAFGAPLEFGGGKYWGTAALGVDTLSLDSLYSETRLRVGWAYPLKENFWFGAALARMSLTYGSDQYTAVNPVLAGAKGASGMGLDLGAVYSLDPLDVGFSIQNANEPDLGLKYANKVARKMTLGLALKKAAFTWDADLSVTGSDLKIRSGAELPFMRDTFGDKALARGGLSLGSRDYRALSAGFGYRSGVYRVDYSFVYPLSGLAGTTGSHQLGVAVAWGDARGPLANRAEQYTRDEAEKNKPAGAGQGNQGDGEMVVKKTAPTKYETDKANKILAEARLTLRNGAYEETQRALKKADDLLMGTDPAAKELLVKVSAVAAVFPLASAPSERDDVIRKAVVRYTENNADAVLYATYARQKWPRDVGVARLYGLVARDFPQTASELRILPGITIVDQLLQDALDFIRTGRFIQAISKLQQVLQLEPDNIPALTRMGSAYWAMEKKDLAKKNWQRVLDLDPNNKEVLQFMKMN